MIMTRRKPSRPQISFDDPAVGRTYSRRPRLRIGGKDTPPCMEVKTWRKKDGGRVSIPDLDDQHLANIIAMVKRNGYESGRILAALQAEQNYRFAKTKGDAVTTWKDAIEKVRKLNARPAPVGWQLPTAVELAEYGYTTTRITRCGFAMGIVPLLFGRFALCAGIVDNMGHDIEYQYETFAEAVKAMQAVDHEYPEVSEPKGWARAMPGHRYGYLDENGAWYCEEGERK